MNATARTMGALPHLGWFTVLAVALLLGATTTWVAAAGLLVFALVQRIWPFDFLTSYLVLAAGASFVDYTRGQLTPELTLITVLIGFMLYCYLLLKRHAFFSISHSQLTWPLLIYLTMSLLNLGRGLLGGGSYRYGGLEILAALAICSALLVGAMDFTRRQLVAATFALVFLGVAHLALGLYVFSQEGVRTGYLSFTPVPGVIAILVFNLILYLRTRYSLLIGTLILALMVLHQFMSFTRGYWFSLAAALAFSILVYVGRGSGVGGRWRRSLAVLGLLGVLFVSGSLMLAELLGMRDIGAEAADRLASSVETDIKYETGSNLVRLSEYLQISKHIHASPWFGHGLGFHFVVREPFSKVATDQWFVHQNYLLVWLKQGLLGVGVFIWILWSAVRTGMGGRLHADPWAAGWCMGAAGATIYVATYSMVHFPLAEVNTVFVLALLWGISISLVSKGRLVVRWRLPHSSTAG